MGNPDIHYKAMCRLFDRVIYNRENTDTSADIEELEKRIQDKEHTPEYYFNAGIAAGQHYDDICDNNDAYNAYLGGLSKFCWLIGLDVEDEDYGE